MLKSEKIKAGPLMSFSGATRRMFAVRPLWVAILIMPLAWLLWVLIACPLYYCGGWLFFRHGRQRMDLIEKERHSEIVARIS